MNITLCYTSRRAAMIQQVIETWLSSAADASRVDVVVGIDADYAEGLEAVEGLVAAGNLPVKLAINSGPSTCVAGWNASAAVAHGDVLIAIADDFSPPSEWDKALQECHAHEWWRGDYVVRVSDGYNPDIFTLSILTKRRYQRFGYIFYPGYASLFCDTEYGHVAQLEGSVIDARHLLFEHLHPDCGKRSRDALDLNHASSERWKQGEMLYNFRKSTGFPVDAGPIADEREACYADMRMAAYIQAIRNDFCLTEVLQRIADEVRDNFGAAELTRRLEVFVAVPDSYWSGKLQEDWQRDEIEEAVRAFSLTHPEVKVHTLRQHVDDYRQEGRSRIQVETFVRNAAVEFIRAAGFQHILILDGDELWNHGLLAKLLRFVQEFRPNSVFTGMVPVIGLPGYPVERALDKATIYIGPGTWFVECRGVSGFRHELPGHDVIHFTATRRTRAEIAQKMLDSGHADDPDYDFVTWNREVLPNIRPGFRHLFSPTSLGLHMYKPYNPWPSCRHWTKEELEKIPQSLWRFLEVPQTV